MTKWRRVGRAMFLGVAIALVTTAAWGIQSTIGYQGLITDANGEGINNNYATVIFRLWDHPTNGTPGLAPLWEEIHVGVTVVEGSFGASLGAPAIGTPSPLPPGAQIGATDLWLEIEFNGEVLSPRTALASAGGALYAAKASDADTVGGIAAADVLTGTHASQGDAHHAKTSSFTELTDMADEAQIPASIARDTELAWNNLQGIPAGFADGDDAYNSAFDTEAEIDAAVGNNGYSTGAHTIDTNAASLCVGQSVLAGDGTCDSIDSTGACAPGAVCGGGHTHAVTEVITGGLDIGDNNYAHAAKTGYLHIPGATLRPWIEGTSYTLNASGSVTPTSPNTSFYGFAPVDLPDGATVTGMRIYAYDNDSSGTTPSWLCRLNRRPAGGSVEYTVVQYSNSVNWVASTTVIQGNITGVPHVVDKSSNIYYLYAGVGNTDSSTGIRHYGCTVIYTYNNTNN